MTTVTEPPTHTLRWHVNRNPAHITRHAEPDCNWVHTWRVENFTEDQKLYGTAVHEAAHAVLLCAAGVPIHSITVRTMTDAAAASLPNGENTRGPYKVALYDLLTGLCAGERAEDRWLHQTNLWTPNRAWAIERHARNDRTMAYQAIQDTADLPLTYGQSSDWTDLAVIHDHTDQAIDRYWSNITDLADALITHRHLNAKQIVRIARIDNPAA
ncbi:hypothetical protein [Streptomyces sp. 5-6(2022)]|uniref:hypothetical protein n=1 Tax=Streptomyces sp. 5-6(2022) TaxID=2936510 RepID=UPI0023B9D3E3|nr:hypothetical protein [Streptomyces sp. 5-6(2022)]